MIEAVGSRRRPIVVAAIAIAAAVAISLAASHSVAAGPDAVPSSHTEYLPSISDLMIATIQPRHERLWRAEQDGDWEFAAYAITCPIRNSLNVNLMAHDNREPISP